MGQVGNLEKDSLIALSILMHSLSLIVQFPIGEKKRERGMKRINACYFYNIKTQERESK